MRQPSSHPTKRHPRGGRSRRQPRYYQAKRNQGPAGESTHPWASIAGEGGSWRSQGQPQSHPAKRLPSFAQERPIPSLGHFHIQHQAPNRGQREPQRDINKGGKTKGDGAEEEEGVEEEEDVTDVDNDTFSAF